MDGDDPLSKTINSVRRQIEEHNNKRIHHDKLPANDYLASVRVTEDYHRINKFKTPSINWDANYLPTCDLYRNELDVDSFEFHMYWLNENMEFIIDRDGDYNIIYCGKQHKGHESVIKEVIRQ